VGNWGWSIVILTILIKLVFYPLNAKAGRSMAQMKVLAPKMEKLKQLYGEDRQKLNQAMMELYRTEKINPLGGCLPILVQIRCSSRSTGCCSPRSSCATRRGWAGSTISPRLIPISSYR
jgi:membrane protein insertase Oxa1/YidC/SpoIIIJ